MLFLYPYAPHRLHLVDVIKYTSAIDYDGVEKKVDDLLKFKPMPHTHVSIIIVSNEIFISCRDER